MGWVLHSQRRTHCCLEGWRPCVASAHCPTSQYKFAIGQGCRLRSKGNSDCPNPRSADQTYPLSERDTKGLNFGVDGGERLPRVSARHQEGLRRDFKISKRILKKYGFSQACSGCHAAQFGLRQGASREHTSRSTGEDVRLLEDRDRRKAGICQDAQREHKHDAPDLRNDSVAEHPTPERDGGVADTLDTIGSDLDDNLQQHDNEHGGDDEVSVLESDQEVEGANRVRKFLSDEEAPGGSKRCRLELLKTLNSTEIHNMVAHLDEKEITVLKALHTAPVLKPFNDSAADSNADTAEA